MGWGQLVSQGASTPVPALAGQLLSEKRCRSCRRASHVGKRLLGGLKGLFAQPPVWSTRKRERIWDYLPAMPRCGCGSTARLQALLPRQGDVRRGWSHPRALCRLHKATLRGVLRARICQVFNWCEPLVGQRQGSRGCRPAQKERWLSRGSSTSPGMLQARQPPCHPATALQSPSLQVGHRAMLVSVFCALGRMTKYSRELNSAPAWKNGLVIVF